MRVLAGMTPPDHDLLSRLEETLPDDVAAYTDADVALFSSDCILERDGVVVAFDGYLYEDDEPDATVAEMYSVHGAAFPAHVDGSFRAALYDTARERLLIATDRPGTKQVLYRDGPDRFLFGTRFQHLLAAAAGEPELDRTAAMRYLMRPYYPYGGGRTLLAGVDKMYASQLLRHDGDDTTTETYWDVRGADTASWSHAEATERLREKILEAASHVTGEQLQVMVSGGLDSAFLLGALREAGHEDIETYTLGWEEEQFIGHEVAEEFGTDHTRIQRTYDLPDPDDIWRFGCANQSMFTFRPAKLIEEQDLSLVATGFSADVPFPPTTDRSHWLDRIPAGRHIARALKILGMDRVLYRLGDGRAGRVVDILASPYASSVGIDAHNIPRRQRRKMVRDTDPAYSPPGERMDSHWNLENPPESHARTTNYLMFRERQRPWGTMSWHRIDEFDLFSYPPLLETVFRIPFRRRYGRRYQKRIGRDWLDRPPSAYVDDIDLEAVNRERLERHHDRYTTAMERFCGRDFVDADAAERSLLKPMADATGLHPPVMWNAYVLERWIEAFIEADEPWRSPD